MNKLRVPDIYIIGAQKSGTTTLYDWLAQHPQIYANILAKDYPYFSDVRCRENGPRLFHSFVEKTPSGHVALGGEANAMYALEGPRRMFETMPQAKLIAILRDPVARAYSGYTYAVERLMEKRSFKQAIEEELYGLRYKPRDALQRDYLGHGHYAKQLNVIFHFFSREQVKIMNFECLKNKPLEVLRDLLSWIGVDRDFVPDMAVKNQTKGGVRYKWFAKFTHSLPDSPFVCKGIRTLLPYSVRTNIRRKLLELNRMPRPKPEFPDEVRQLLREYYRNEIHDLEKLVGKEISIH